MTGHPRDVKTPMVSDFTLVINEEGEDGSSTINFYLNCWNKTARMFKNPSF
jgi:hypothetical protein